MITNKISVTFTDAAGKEHSCKEVGHKRVVTVAPQTRIEDTLIVAVRTASCDSSIRPGVSILNIPGTDAYIVKSESSFYFVKPITSNVFEVILNETFGFEVIKGYSFRAETLGDIIVFYMFDNATHNRVGPYRYVTL